MSFDYDSNGLSCTCLFFSFVYMHILSFCLRSYPHRTAYLLFKFQRLHKLVKELLIYITTFSFWIFFSSNPQRGWGSSGKVAHKRNVFKTGGGGGVSHRWCMHSLINHGLSLLKILGFLVLRDKTEASDWILVPKLEWYTYHIPIAVKARGSY